MTDYNHKMKPPFPIRLVLSGCRVAKLFARFCICWTGTVQADSYTWNGNTGATWNTTGTNWNGTPTDPWTATNGASNIAIFNNASATPNLTGTVYANGITFNNTATVAGGTTLTLNGTAPTIDVSTNITAEISSLISGSAGLTKTGAGILTISHANNTFSGTTTILEGKILIPDLSGSQTSLGTTSVLLGSATGTATTGALYYTGNTGIFSHNITVQAGGGEFETTTAGQTLTISGTVSLGGNFLVEAAGNATISGSVTGTGNLTKDGSGILTLSHTDNTFNGTVTILNGKIQVTDINGSLTGLGAGTTAVVLGSGTASTAGALYYTGTTISTLSRAITVQTGGGEFETTSTEDSTAATLSGAVGLSGNFLVEGAGSTTISGVISSTSTAGSLTKNGTGTLTLSNANTYTGNTLVSLGTLKVGNNLALQDSTLDTSGAGVINVTGSTTPTLGGLSGSKNLTSVITTGYSSVTALTLNPGTGITDTYSGIIANGASSIL